MNSTVIVNGIEVNAVELAMIVRDQENKDILTSEEAEFALKEFNVDLERFKVLYDAVMTGQKYLECSNVVLIRSHSYLFDEEVFVNEKASDTACTILLTMAEGDDIKIHNLSVECLPNGFTAMQQFFEDVKE